MMNSTTLHPILMRIQVAVRRTIRSRLVLQMVIALLLAGCLSPLDRFSEYTGGQLVISGQISSIPESSEVYVARTSDLERLPEPVSGVNVSLFEDGVEASVFLEDATRAGRYVLPDFIGTPGKTYQIQVTLPDGEQFVSAPEQMPVLVGEDEVSYRIEPDKYTDGEGTVAERLFLKIYTNHALPSSTEPVFLKWHVEEVYALSPTDFPDPFGFVPPSCYIAQQIDPQRILLFSTEGTTVTSIPELFVASRLIDMTFKERHYFTTYQSSLTREAYEYWRQVDIVSNQNGSIFDAPPARVKGNISARNDSDQEVHGYFQAVNQKFTRFYLLPDDLPFRMTLHCEYRSDRPFEDYPSECLDCQSVRNSSYNRPPWF